MHKTSRLFATVCIALAAAVGSSAVPSALQITDAGGGAHAQEPNRTAQKRIYIWTRARIAAANKHWAKDAEKYSFCSEQLQQKQKKRRLGLHAQADFMQDCMNRLP
jgi:hypothetical protein